jgi:hypothetical protein
LTTPLHVTLSQLSSFAPFLGGLFKFKHLKRDTKILFAFFTVALITEAIVKILAYNKINNLWLFHVFTIVEYSFWVIVFSFWQKEHNVKKILKVSILIFAIIWLVNLIFSIERFSEYNNVSRSIESILLTAIALFTIYNSYLESYVELYKNYIFCFSIGVLIYFSGNFLFFSLGSSIVNGIDVGTIHSILNISANLCYLRGFLCLPSR